MKYIGSIYLVLFFTLTTQIAWGQTPDPAKPSSTTDTVGYKTVTSDRINEADDRERGPSLAKMLKMADESFAKKNYFQAMVYYRNVVKAEPMQVDALKGLGESALAILSLDIADSAFQRMVDRGLSPSPDYFPKMQLAEVKFRKGKYPEAAMLYEDISTIAQPVPVTEAIKRKAAERLELCLWAQGAGVDNPYIIKGDSCVLLDTAHVNTVFGLNKVSYSEYVANVQDDNLYFSAYRFDFKKDRSNPKRNTIKLLKADGAEGNLGISIPMNVTETEFNDLKRQHTAHITFSQSGKVVYYSLGDYVGDSANIRFDLYRRTRQADSTWSQPEKLNVVNAPKFTNTEPCVGTLPGQNHETLFFVSDRPGSKRGKNIWTSQILGDSLTAPVPLDELNTNGDDVCPFYHASSNTLFFSTDSLLTLGGFDIYKTKINPSGHWKKPEHMGAPVNGPANDVYFVLDKESKRGFFSSNRNGSTNYSEEGCCYDIYAVDFLKRYRAIGFHAFREQILPYTNITLYERSNNGKFIELEAPLADASSSYAFDVKINTSYRLIGKKTGFISDTLDIKTPDELWTSEIVDTLFMRPIIKLHASVYDSDTDEPINGANFTFYDLGYKDLKAIDFIKSGDPGKQETLPPNSNQKSYALTFGHKYRLLAAKDGYVASTSVADSSMIISTLDQFDGGTLEVKLYLHKPNPLEVYLPVTLFFDNDYPKKDFPIQDTILLDYQKTFVNYIRKKEEYKEKFCSVLSGDEKKNAQDTLEKFFEKEVRMNWDSFFALSDLIDLMLQNGDTIILTLKGYASPLSNPDYNFHLTNRRIASVYNHFMIFDGGIFQRYREQVGTGQLRFLREANGSTESEKMGINGDPKDRRHSIYDVQAARARRVQIIGARVSKGSSEKKKM